MVPEKIVASHTFSWLRSKKRNKEKEQELRAWLQGQPNHKPKDGFTYAGYNPPWTIPFLRKNEILIDLDQ